MDTDQGVFVMYLHRYIHTYSLLLGLVKEKAYLKSIEIKKLNDSLGT